MPNLTKWKIVIYRSLQNYLLVLVSSALKTGMKIKILLLVKVQQE